MLLLVVLKAACAALSPLIAELIMLDISVPYIPRYTGRCHQCGRQRALARLALAAIIGMLK